ncbi:hypothetical protein ACS0TY_015081 [Phlomoides rotata]
MSAIYDNWERLVAAVLKKEQLWQLFHQQSRSPSTSSLSSSSDFSFSRLNSSLDGVPFGFSSPQWSAFNQKEEEHLATKTPAPTHSRFLAFREITTVVFEDRGFSRGPVCSEYSSKVSPTLSPRVYRDDAKQESYPLPLPPTVISNSSHVSPSAAKLPSPPSRSPQGAENVKSPGTSWKKGKLIGKGPLGDVYLGFNSEKGQMCVMMEVSLSPKDAETKQNARSLEKEIALLSRINHPNIVQYYGSEMVADSFYIYFEYVSGESTELDNLSEWNSTWLKRILVDYMLRMSYYDTAVKLAECSNIQDLVDIDVFLEAKKVVDALQKKEVAPALAWCAENKSRLKKSKSKFEFQLRLQEFIELVRAENNMRAITYARKYLAPWGATHMKELQRVVATIAFKTNFLARGNNNYMRLAQTFQEKGRMVSKACLDHAECPDPENMDNSSVHPSSEDQAVPQMPVKKVTRRWAAWTHSEEERFFAALWQNFEKITCHVESKDKEQVRHYYYRLVRKMNKMLSPELRLDAKNSDDTISAMLQW